jgi:hypothetical protein
VWAVGVWLWARGEGRRQEQGGANTGHGRSRPSSHVTRSQVGCGVLECGDWSDVGDNAGARQSIKTGDVVVEYSTHYGDGWSR